MPVAPAVGGDVHLARRSPPSSTAASACPRSPVRPRAARPSRRACCARCACGSSAASGVGPNVNGKTSKPTATPAARPPSACSRAARSSAPPSAGELTRRTKCESWSRQPLLDGDRRGLARGVDDPGLAVAAVRRVEAAVRADRLAQGPQLGARRGDPRRVLQPGREPRGARLHRLAHHARAAGRSRAGQLAQLEAGDVEPQRPVRDERHDVDRRPRRGERRHVRPRTSWASRRAPTRCGSRTWSCARPRPRAARPARARARSCRPRRW